MSITSRPSPEGNNSFSVELKKFTEGYGLIVENDTLKSASLMTVVWEKIKGFFGGEDKTAHVSEKVIAYITEHKADIQNLTNESTETLLIIKLAQQAGIISPTGILDYEEINLIADRIFSLAKADDNEFAKVRSVQPLSPDRVVPSIPLPASTTVFKQRIAAQQKEKQKTDKPDIPVEEEENAKAEEPRPVSVLTDPPISVIVNKKTDLKERIAEEQKEKQKTDKLEASVEEDDNASAEEPQSLSVLIDPPISVIVNKKTDQQERDTADDESSAKGQMEEQASAFSEQEQEMPYQEELSNNLEKEQPAISFVHELPIPETKGNDETVAPAQSSLVTDKIPEKKIKALKICDPQNESEKKWGLTPAACAVAMITFAGLTASLLHLHGPFNVSWYTHKSSNSQGLTPSKTPPVSPNPVTSPLFFKIEKREVETDGSQISKNVVPKVLNPSPSTEAPILILEKSINDSNQTRPDIELESKTSPTTIIKPVPLVPTNPASDVPVETSPTPSAFVKTWNSKEAEGSQISPPPIEAPIPILKESRDDSNHASSPDTIAASSKANSAEDVDKIVYEAEKTSSFGILLLLGGILTLPILGAISLGVRGKKPQKPQEIKKDDVFSFAKSPDEQQMKPGKNTPKKALLEVDDSFVAKTPIKEKFDTKSHEETLSWVSSSLVSLNDKLSDRVKDLNKLSLNKNGDELNGLQERALDLSNQVSAGLNLLKQSTSSDFKKLEEDLQNCEFKLVNLKNVENNLHLQKERIQEKPVHLHIMPSEGIVDNNALIIPNALQSDIQPELDLSKSETVDGGLTAIGLEVDEVSKSVTNLKLKITEEENQVQKLVAIATDLPIAAQALEDDIVKFLLNLPSSEKNESSLLSKLVHEKSLENLPLLTRESKYGNKFRGLQNIHNILSKHPLYNVVVPFPTGISHDEVYQILEDRDPEIFKEWEELGRSYRDSDGVEFLQRSTTTDALSLIRKRIENVFSNENLRVSTELGVWLADKKGHDLMVRSSSIEDSQVVNAGGNLSEAYVPSDPQKVLASCGRVVASYFGESSLKNQIQVGVNPFKSSLQLSVIIQELIGESVGNTDAKDIPVSLVLFTTEPNYSEGKFRVTTMGVALGHGEGVVNNETVKTDTVYTVQSRHKEGERVEIYQKKAKPQRLAPKKSPTGVSLQLVDNPIELIEKRCLTKAMVGRLAELGDLVEKITGCPMDMEIVIKGDVIHVVQMREILRKKPNPTYLSDETIQKTGKAPILETQYAKLLVGSESKTLNITSQKEVLCCTTLKEAERKFKLGIHKLVVVEKDEPDLSHPVIYFGGVGTPCFFSQRNHKDLFKKINVETSLVVCPQSGRLCLWDEKLVKPEDCIKQGFFSHPANFDFSWKNPGTLYAKGSLEIPQEIIEVFRALKTEQTTDKVLNILNDMKQRPAVTQLKGKIKELKTNAQGLDSVIAEAAIKNLKKLDDRIQKTFKEIQASYQHLAPRLENLFHIESLATLLHGNQASNSFSLLQVDSYIERTKRAIEYQKRFPDAKFVDLLNIDDLILNPQDKQKWEEFLIALEERKIEDQSIASFKTLLESLHESESLPLWINLFFLPKQKETSDVSQLISILIPSNHQEAENFIYLVDSIKKIKGFDPSAFNHPVKFKKQWQTLQSMMQEHSSQKRLERLLKSDFNQFLTLGLMKEFTEVVDKSIKNMKMSSDFSDEEKLVHFNAMLKGNYEVMKAWCEVAHNKAPLPFTKTPTVRYGGVNNLPEYYEFIDQAWRILNLNDPGNLNSSSKFSVQASTIGSLANKSRHEPCTLEDIFTLIHQNQLAAIAHLSNLSLPKNSISNLGMPEACTNLINRLEAYDNFNGNWEMTGLKISENAMVLNYNLPLSNHSASCDIVWDKISGIKMHVGFFGHARERWKTIFQTVECLHEAGILKAYDIGSYTEEEVKFTWEVEDKKIDILAKTLEALISSAWDASNKLELNVLFSEFDGGEKAAEIAFQKMDSELFAPLLIKHQDSQFFQSSLETIRNEYGKSDEKDVIEKQIAHIYRLEKMLSFYTYQKNAEVEKFRQACNYDVIIPRLLNKLTDKKLDWKIGLDLMWITRSFVSNAVAEEPFLMLFKLIDPKEISNYYNNRKNFLDEGYYPKIEPIFNERLKSAGIKTLDFIQKFITETPQKNRHHMLTSLRFLRQLGRAKDVKWCENDRGD